MRYSSSSTLKPMLRSDTSPPPVHDYIITRLHDMSIGKLN
nr:MAG TPA: hypothetical protein [Caudoviricetes sp.]